MHVPKARTHEELAAFTCLSVCLGDWGRREGAHRPESGAEWVRTQAWLRWALSLSLGWQARCAAGHFSRNLSDFHQLLEKKSFFTFSRCSLGCYWTLFVVTFYIYVQGSAKEMALSSENSAGTFQNWLIGLCIGRSLCLAALGAGILKQGTFLLHNPVIRTIGLLKYSSLTNDHLLV